MPLEAGPEVCAFVRGGEVVAAAAIRGDGSGAPVPLPAGHWRSVLDGAEAEGEAAIGTHGIALLERVDR
jgi:hypothetical protein